MSFLHHPAALWAIVALVGIIAVFFGAISVTTGLFTAVGIGMMAVGLAMLFRPNKSGLGLGVILLGGLVWFGQSFFPRLTIASALSFTGVQI